MSKLNKLSLMLMCQICTLPVHAADNIKNLLTSNDLAHLGYRTPLGHTAEREFPFPVYKNEEERKESEKFYSVLPNYSLIKSTETSPDSNNRHTIFLSDMTNQHTPPEFSQMPSGMPNSFGSLFLDDYDVPFGLEDYNVPLARENEILFSVLENYCKLENLKSNAENGHPESQYILGVNYLEKSKEETEFAQSYHDKGIDYLEKAAKKDYIKSVVLLANYYYQKHKENKDINYFNKSEEYCLQGIELKVTIALRGLATLYLTSQDYHKRAISLYEKAKKHGDPHAALDLGLIYQQGKIVDRNLQTALKCFEEAANAGIIKGKFHLGILLVHMGNKREGQKWLDELEKSEDKHALCMLGELYTGNQHQIFKDPSKAILLLKRSSKLGSQNANYNLGILYQQLGDHEEAQFWSSKTGKHLPKDPTSAKASDHTKPAVKQKSKLHKPGTTIPLEKKEIEAVSKKRERTETPLSEIETQSKLSKLIIKTNPRSRTADNSMDTDVETSLPPHNGEKFNFVSINQKRKDESESVISESLRRSFDYDIRNVKVEKAFGQDYKWTTPGKSKINKDWFDIQIAIAPNNANAALELAQGYEKGTSGLEKSPVLALKYYEIAANLGNAKAQYQLALMTKELDPIKAFNLIKSSADQNNSSALYALGVLYLRGIGTEANHFEAFKNFVSAANYGHDEASNILYWMFLNEIALPKDKIKAYLAEHANASLLSHPQMTNIIAEIVIKNLEIKSSIGDSNANYKLGHMYYKKGEFKKALKLFELSANKQNHLAYFALGNLYKLGQGTVIDLNAAFKHFVMSANFGNSAALDQIRSMYLAESDLKQRAYFKAYLNAYGRTIMFSDQIISFITNPDNNVNPLKKTALENKKRINSTNSDWLKPHSTQWTQEIINQYTNEAQNGCPKAQIKLAKAHQNGHLNLDVNLQEAIALYEKAAAQESAEALFELVEIYYGNSIIPKDVKKYLEYLERGVELGHKEAQYQLGERYRIGLDVPKDCLKASDLLLKAAQKGHIHAQYKLALLYIDGEMEGGPTELNTYKGIEWLEKSAEAGYVKAIHALGLFYFQGKHTNKDVDKAHELVRSAAKMGYAISQHYLARLYLNDSTKKHIKEGCQFLISAANADYPDAQYDLGLCLLNGKYFSQDTNRGLGYLKLASDKEHTAAQYCYGEILFDGKFKDKLICEADPELGTKLMQEATKKGHKVEKPSQEKMDRALSVATSPLPNNEMLKKSTSANTPKTEPSNSGGSYTEWTCSNQPKNQFVHTLDKEKKLEEIISPTLFSAHNIETLTRKDLKTYLPSQGISMYPKPGNNPHAGHYSYSPYNTNNSSYNNVIYNGYNNVNYYNPLNNQFHNYMGHIEGMNIPEHLKPSQALRAPQVIPHSQRIVIEEKPTPVNKPEPQ